jgi:hypothetical protein
LTSAHNVTDSTLGNGILLTVGWNSGGIRTSSDGVQWAEKEFTTSGKGVCFGNGYFWIITPGNKLMKTLDGDNLITTKIDFFSDSIAYGKGLLVSINQFNGIRYSSDGINWNTSLIPISPGVGGKLFYSDGLFIATCNGNLMTSTDAVTWLLKDSNVYSYPRTICRGENEFIVVSSDGNMTWKSVDGSSWVASNNGPKFSTNDLHFANGKFFAAGVLGKVSVSEDGTTWVPQATGVTFTLESLISLGDTIIAGGSQVIRNTVAAPTDPHPILEVTSSIELKFNSANGVVYSIEGSSNLTQWNLVEKEIFGNGGQIRRLYSIENQPNRFFRIVIP